MLYSIVEYKDLEADSHRLDGEYYQQLYLDAEKLLRSQKWVYLDPLTHDIKSFGAYALCNLITYQEEGIPFLRAVDFKRGFVDFSSALQIDEDSHKLLWKSNVKPGTVLLTMSGSVGNAAMAMDDWDYPVNSSQDVAKISTNSKVNPYYLTVFLSSKYGKLQTRRLPIGSIQQHIFLWQLKKLIIPLLSDGFQELIGITYQQSYQMLQDSKHLYTQAETHLLTELGLRDWQPCHHLTFEATFADSQATARFDAEYFQPRYQFAMTAMRRSGKTVKDFATLIKRRFRPEHGQDFNYIEIAGVSGNGYAHSNVVAGSKAPSRAQWIVKRDDIITSTVRPIRSLTALIEPEQDGYVCSSGFAVLKSNGIEPELLLVYLKLPIVCEILDLHTTASMYPAISTHDLLAIPVTLPDDQIMKQRIITLVRNSRLTHHNSKRLLNLAKIAVERAIEQDEAIATTWLRAEVEKLNVDLDI
jgi:restriction endonuclease S subunit